MKSNFVCLLLLVFAACTKNPKGQSPANDLPSERIAGVVSASNPENPYDSVGIIHNIALAPLNDFVAQRREADPKQMLAYLQQRFPESCPANIQTALDKIDPELLKLSSNNPSQLFATLPMREPVREYLFQLTNIINKLDTGNASLLIQQIIALERRVSTDKSLTEKDVYLLLSSTSTARYSLQYWTEHGADLFKTTVPRSIIGDALRWVGAVVNAVVADVSAVAICDFVGLPLTWWPWIISVGSSLAYATIMGW